MIDKDKLFSGSSGNSITLPFCRKCDRKNAHGADITRESDGRRIFLCDHCGQWSSMGWDYEHHMQMVNAKDDYSHSAENRERWRREFVTKFEEDYAKAAENLSVRPDAVQNFETMLHPHLLENTEGNE